MTTKLMSVESFHNMVRKMVKEAIREEMVAELERLNLEDEELHELGAQPPPIPAAAKVGGAAKPPPVPPQAKGTGNKLMVPGTNMGLDQFLIAASKEQDPKKKLAMIAQAAQITSTMNTLEEKPSTFKRPTKKK